jgi:hypothetical protein
MASSLSAMKTSALLGAKLLNATVYAASGAPAVGPSTAAQKTMLLIATRRIIERPPSRASKDTAAHLIGRQEC